MEGNESESSGVFSLDSCEDIRKDDDLKEESAATLLQSGEIIQGRDCSYKVIRVLGEGNCSVVYSGETCHSAEPVAIKVFKKGRIYENAADREFKVLEHVAESQVDTAITFLAAFQYKEHFCFVFEQLDLNIRQLIMKNRRRGLPAWTVQKFAKDVFKCLAHLHKIGYVHGDLKPGNIMWSGQQGVFKCFDFGLSFHVQEDAGHAHLIHSMGYRAPEVLALEHPHSFLDCDDGEHEIGFGADVWAVGCLLLEALAGRKLFRTGEILQKEKCIMSHVDKLLEETKQIYQQNSNIHQFDKFCDLLAKCLAFHPDERITAAEALNDPALSCTIPVSNQDNILLVSPVLKFTFSQSVSYSDIEEKCRKFGTIVETKKHKDTLYVQFLFVREAVRARNQFTCPSSNRISVHENIVILNKAKENEPSQQFTTEFYPLELWYKF